MIAHRFTSPKPDLGDATLVQPSNWNDAHLFDIPVSLGGYVAVTNVGATYDAVNVGRGLGFIDMVMDGIDTVVFTVQCNKIGTGTISWQLWNETNGAELGVLNDTGAGGNKTLGPLTISGLALTGTKRLRVRAKSTVSTDDPVYYGSSLLLRRTS